MEVCGAIREAGAEMEQDERRPIGHAAIAVRSPRAHAFEKPEHRAYPDGVERRDEVHLGRAGVREAELNARPLERANQRLGAIHSPLLMRQSAAMLTAESRLWWCTPAR